jgi:peptide/nickel transport system permease protein
MRYLVMRLSQAAALLMGVSLLSFVLLQMSPGDYFQEMRLNPQISQTTVERLRGQYGLDKPILVRYGRWLVSVARGEFGISLAYGTPVGPLLWARARNTLLLTVTATLLGWIVAVILGVLCAIAPRSIFDRCCSILSSLTLAIPELLLCLALLAIAVRTGWFASGGMRSVGANTGATTWFHQARDLAGHLVLPVTALVLGTLPVFFWHVRNAVFETLDLPFIHAAEGHGIPRLRILSRYAMPVAANALISLFGLSIGSLLSISLVTEVITSWPGLGPLLLEAVLARDVYVVIGAVTVSALFLVCGIILADVLLYASDPRIRAERLA